MDEHRRWLCKECHREWVEPTAYFANSAPVSISGNPPGLNCQYCGSPEKELIGYKPDYPGLDIPRAGDFKVIPTEMMESTARRFHHVEKNNLPDDGLKDTIVPAIIIEEKRNDAIFDLSDMD